MASEGSLDIIALVSGGKDSFYSILHGLANGHRVVALANLYPPPPPVPTRDPAGERAGEEAEEERDLNSFMYQTVGHQVIPLYAQATGLPLFRQPIAGTAVHHGLSYRPRDRPQASSPDSEHGGDDQVSATTATAPSAKEAPGRGRKDEEDEDEEDEDETESLVPLLRAVMRAHPTANALCTGAILSTYQRTRVESVALRLGLVPLAYLWQYPELPVSPSGCSGSGPAAAAATTATTHGPPSLSTGGGGGGEGLHPRGSAAQRPDDGAQLLRDMAEAGLDARIVKVASAGLDEDVLWTNVASAEGTARVQRALRRFGGGGGSGSSRGAAIGEGGEFETLVLDGPPALFRGRIVVPDGARRVVREGGGCAWLRVDGAHVEMKEAGEVAAAAKQVLEGGESQRLGVRVPALLDPRFEHVLQGLRDASRQHGGFASRADVYLRLPNLRHSSGRPEDSPQEWCFTGGGGDADDASSVEAQTGAIVEAVRARLRARGSLPANVITNAVVALRRMADFPRVNLIYGALFDEPNPPARVTISCGDRLPAAIAVYLTVQPRLRPAQRRGLHVQSRSYWAPANIGPYSQAVAFPLLVPDGGETAAAADDHGPRAVCIAGQIPLVPSTMALPPPAPSSSPDVNQIVLALQHLWRVAAETGVQWWTSAVAYFPHQAGDEAPRMRRQALAAATAWREAHLWPPAGPADEEDDAGPDLWDRRFNPQYRTYGDADADARTPSPPDWAVLRGFEEEDEDEEGREERQEEKIARLPPLFAAEVAELPRAAGVEWHAHAGLAGVDAGSVQVSTIRGIAVAGVEGTLDLHHVVVDTPGGVFVQTTAAVTRGGDGGVPVAQAEGVTRAVAASLEKLTAVSELGATPKITYAEDLQAGADVPEALGGVIPCRSLWDSQGRRLALAAIYETRLAKG
ncbi:adenine nucleotide alpha hydrolases-like protein [Xylariomycetidae sp. FL0641]|nr:adenine nucleotide alpha hydrolases-like protein [Xylariomycetidae sp. FL0641]